MKNLTVICKWAAVAAMAVAAVACSKKPVEKPEVPVDEQVRIPINISMGVWTKVTDVAYEKGDQTGIYVVNNTESGESGTLVSSGNHVDNMRFTYAEYWTPDTEIYWADKTTKADFYCYFPYGTPTDVTAHPFSVQADQSALESYKASEFLWGKVSGVEQTATETVELQFRHCLSKFVIQMVKGPSYEGDFPEDAEVYIHSTVPTATIDFTTGSVTKDLFGEMATIKARKVNDSTFEAIIVPQRLDTRRPFIEIIAGGISYLLEDTFQFKPGMQHTLSLTINSNPDQIEIEIGGDIEDGDWN